MLKFSKILILVCRKILSAFSLILHDTFSNSCGFHLISEFNLFSPHLILYDRKHFCSILTNLSNLSHRRQPFLFKFALLSSDLKNVFRKNFQKMQSFEKVFQNKFYYKFPDIHKNISVLQSVFSKATGMMACNFI